MDQVSFCLIFEPTRKVVVDNDRYNRAAFMSFQAVGHPNLVITICLLVVNEKLFVR